MKAATRPRTPKTPTPEQQAAQARAEAERFELFLLALDEFEATLQPPVIDPFASY